MQATHKSIPAKCLIIAAYIAAGTAIWHLLCIPGGPEWYVFARAPKVIVDSARQGTMLAPIGASVVAMLMLICAAYAFSAAGVIRKIPLMKSALVTISCICITRAMIAIPYLRSAPGDTWEVIASSGWLLVGICILIGAVEQFRARKIA